MSLSNSEVSFVGYAFVDDTDLCQGHMDPEETLSETIRQMQQILDMWEGLLNATDSALGPDKTKWWALNYCMDNDKLRYGSEQELPGELHVKDPFGIRTDWSHIKRCRH